MAHSELKFLDFKGFKSLMAAFRFKVDSANSLRNEFDFTLRQNGELSHASEKRANAENLFEEDEVFRFDLARQIFLDRGL
jgi:hypothetical protein